jgi:hypothetical protein
VRVGAGDDPVADQGAGEAASDVTCRDPGVTIG